MAAHHARSALGTGPTSVAGGTAPDGGERERERACGGQEGERARHGRVRDRE